MAYKGHYRHTIKSTGHKHCLKEAKTCTRPIYTYISSRCVDPKSILSPNKYHEHLRNILSILKLFYLLSYEKRF